MSTCQDLIRQYPEHNPLLLKMGFLPIKLIMSLHCRAHVQSTISRKECMVHIYIYIFVCLRRGNQGRLEELEQRIVLHLNNDPS